MFSRARSGGLQIEQVGTVAVACMPGPVLLDPLLIRDLGQQLTALAEGQGAQPQLVVNLSQVEHLGSAMVGTLMALHKQVVGAGGRLAICGLRPLLAEAFTITGLHEVLHLYPGQAEALLSF